MATIQPNFNPAMRPAQVQAERLKGLPDKSAYNEFVDATLQSRTFIDSASADAKALATMARNVGSSIPDKDTRAKFLQAGFEAALSGSVAGAPGGVAAVMAKMVLDIMPNLHESRRDGVATQALAGIAYASQGTEAGAHADFALDAGDKAKSAKTAILMNGLGVIADLGGVSEKKDDGTEKAVADFRKVYQDLECKTADGFPNRPSSMENKGVVVLTRDPQSGELRESSGFITPEGFSGTALFRLNNKPELFNSNDILGMAELPFAVRGDTPELARHDLKTQKEYRDDQKAFWAPYSAQGFDTGSGYSAFEMSNRQVALLYREEDGTKREITGTVMGTDRKANARFTLLGHGELNSNNIMAVAFTDGMRAPT